MATSFSRSCPQACHPMCPQVKVYLGALQCSLHPEGSSSSHMVTRPLVDHLMRGQPLTVRERGSRHTPDTETLPLVLTSGPLFPEASGHESSPRVFQHLFRLPGGPFCHAFSRKQLPFSLIMSLRHPIRSTLASSYLFTTASSAAVSSSPRGRPATTRDGRGGAWPALLAWVPCGPLVFVATTAFSPRRRGSLDLPATSLYLKTCSQRSS